MITIRRGTPKDALPIIAVQRAAVRGIAATHYPADIIEEWAPLPIQPEQISERTRCIENAAVLAVIAENANKEIIGAGTIIPAAEELNTLYVLPSAERQGIGQAIIHKLEEMAYSVGIRSLLLNASLNAVQFYQSNNYKVCNWHAEYVLRPERKMACVTMRKNLIS